MTIDPLERVVIVDADQSIQVGLQSAFHARCIAACGVASRDEALLAVQRWRPQLALVELLPWPESSGLGLIEELHRVDERLTIMALTALPTADSTARALLHGAVAVLPKPVCIDNVLDVYRCDARRSDGAPRRCSLARAEWNYIQSVLASCNGNVSATARWLKIPRKSLQRKLRRNPPLD